MVIWDDFRQARAVSTPLIAIATPDQPATIAGIAERLGPEVPVVEICAAEGLRGRNPTGQALATLLIKERLSGRQELSRDLMWCLRTMHEMPQRTCLFFHNAQLWLDQGVIIQGIANLRETNPGTGRTLILLGPTITLPPALVQDVLTLREPLPNDDQLSQTLDLILNSSSEQLDSPVDEETRRKAIEAVRGLSQFAAQNAIAWSLSRKGINLERLWGVKRRQVQQVRGVRFGTATHSFDQVGGLTAFRNYMVRVGKGRRPIAALVFIDEIDKAMQGSVGESGDSGVSADRLAVLLQFMEEHKIRGSLLVGVPGAGKTYVTEAVANTLTVPALKLDLGAMLGGIIGQSQQQVREALDVVYAVGGDRIFFLATCNRLESLPPELRRRFKIGPWFFDLPSREEKDAVWLIALEQAGLEAQRAEVDFDIDQARPADPDWTPDDITKCVTTAYDLDISLIEAAQLVVPVAHQDPESVQRLRDLADHQFLAASYPGKYQKPSTPLVAQSERKIDLGET